MQENRPTATLRAMAEAGIEFTIVGGVAAVLNGAPLNTFDLDIVHARNAANVAKLLALLDSLDAIFRVQRERGIKATADYISRPGHWNLITVERLP